MMCTIDGALEIAIEKQSPCNVCQVVASRIFAFVRQPAFLVHVADTLGALAEKTCQQLVAHGRLDFRGIVDHILAEEEEHAPGEEQPSTEQTREALASIVMKLLQRRLVEQASTLPASLCTAVLTTFSCYCMCNSQANQIAFLKHHSLTSMIHHSHCQASCSAQTSNFPHCLPILAAEME